MSTINITGFDKADIQSEGDTDTSFLITFSTPHNFVPFDVLTVQGTELVKPIADKDNIVLGVVTKVIGAHSIILSVSGSFYVPDVTTLGLTPEKAYYLSNTIPGKVQATPPASYVYPVFYTRKDRIYLTLNMVYGGASILSKLNALTARVTSLESRMTAVENKPVPQNVVRLVLTITVAGNNMRSANITYTSSIGYVKRNATNIWRTSTGGHDYGGWGIIVTHNLGKYLQDWSDQWYYQGSDGGDGGGYSGYILRDVYSIDGNSFYTDLAVPTKSWSTRYFNFLLA